MIKLAKYMKPHWKAAIMAPFLMFIEVVTDLMQPTLMALIVDKGIAYGDMAYVVRTGLLMLGVAFVGGLGGFGCTVFASIASQNFGADLREDLFKSVQQFSFVNLDKFKTASLITRLTNDVVQIQNIVLAMLRILVRAPLLCIGGMVMAFSINPRLSLIVFVSMPFLVVILAFVIKKAFPLFAEVQRRLDGVNTVMQENLAGIRVVKAFVRAAFEKNRFKSANDDLMSITITASRLVAAIMPLLMLIINFSIIAVLWFGGVMVNTGDILVGQVMAFINYMMQILFSLMMVAFILMMLSRAKASADRIQEVLDVDPDIKDRADAIDKQIEKGKVQFKNVSFQYEGNWDEWVLKDISFTANPGETVAILGATGSGKSTLVNLIPRFYDTTEGSVLVDNVDVRDYKLKSLRSSIGVVLQEAVLFSGTIKDNISWGNEHATDEEIDEAAKAAQAHEFISNLPEGYDSILGQRGVNLSGGQKQRLSIARALLKKPAILILDDSTSAVDMGTESRIQKALKELMSHTTTLVIAQRISTVLDADRIIVLDKGKIVSEGPHRELIESCEVYKDIYRSQLGQEAG